MPENLKAILLNEASDAIIERQLSEYLIPMTIFERRQRDHSNDDLDMPFTY